MSREGWIALHRQAMENPLYKEKRAATRREAWEDLLLLANYSPGWIETRDGTKIHCDRGQSIRSLQSWAERFHWSRSRVRRFLAYLQKEGMIKTEGTANTTRITICNYAKYQPTGSLLPDTPTDTATDTATGTDESLRCNDLSKQPTHQPTQQPTQQPATNNNRERNNTPIPRVRARKDDDIKGMIEDIRACREKFDRLHEMDLYNELTGAPAEGRAERVEKFCRDMRNAVEVPPRPTTTLGNYLHYTGRKNGSRGGCASTSIPELDWSKLRTGEKPPKPGTPEYADKVREINQREGKET